MRSRMILALVIAAVMASVRGSAIEFTTSANPIRPPLSTNLTLRCSLQDTTPNVSGGLVGRRKRQMENSSSKPLNYEKTDNRRQSVTNTTTNVDFVTSMIISKDDKDVARLSEHFPAKSVITSPGLLVTGSLSDQAGERGFLQLNWQHPTSEQTGRYTCDIDAMDRQGQRIDFSTSLEIRQEEISLNDLINHVQKIDNDKDNIKATVTKLTQTEQIMNGTISKLTQSEQQMNSTIIGQQKEIASLQQKNSLLTSQVNQLMTKVFFSVGLTTSGSGLTIPINQDMVFDLVFSNVGNGYNSSTGVFTCPVAGYYFFTVNVEASNDKGVMFNLKHNGKKVLYLLTWDSQGYNSASNSGTLKLEVGDTVKVTSWDNGSQVLSQSGYITTTFNGNLLATT